MASAVAAAVCQWPRLLLLLSAVVVGVVSGRCSRRDAVEIERRWQETWDIVSTKAKIAYAKAIYDAVFALDPDAGLLIVDPDAGQATLEEIYSDGELSVEFLHGIYQHDLVIGILKDDTVLQTHLRHVARQKMAWMHARREHFRTLAAGFMQ